MIVRRIHTLRKKIEIDTQKIKASTLENLEEIFRLAASLAKGEFKTQTEDGETAKVSLTHRRMWARVAAYVVQIMKSIAAGFDEKEIEVQLDKLEKLVDKAKAKAKTGKPSVDR